MDHLQPGDPRRVGDYRLLGRLGEGGMGQVFFGRSRGGRPVAVKVIRREYAERQQFRARFAREVEAARKVGGFHTALVVDADPAANPPWMVTAYIPGPSLYGAVTDHGPLPPHTVQTLGAGLAEGLAAIHACGLVHRDLTPRNVILADDGPRIIDFGITRTLDASMMTAAGAVLGTYAYMSPEQLEGNSTGPASDVFSLGSVLIFAATGRSPFHAESVTAIVRRITNEPPDLSEIPAEGGVRDVVAACLAKDPAARPPLSQVLAWLAGPWPQGGWLPSTVMDVVVSRSSDSRDTPSTTHTEQQPAVELIGERKKIRHRVLQLAGVAAAVIAVLLLITIPRHSNPSVATQPSEPFRHIVTDDGRAFGMGGSSQFTLRIDPRNSGVRLTRRLDSGVFGQNASITVNGVQAGAWKPLDGALTTWMDQTVELPPPLTTGKRTLVIKNTFVSSSKDFNEFTYFVDQKINGVWSHADLVDIGPGHPDEEKAHSYRITGSTWEGVQTFGYLNR